LHVRHAQGRPLELRQKNLQLTMCEDS
jgi:hypothetical protein